MDISAQRTAPVLRKWQWLLGATLTVAILLTVFWIDPTAVSWYPPCIFHKLTGLDCPGCGSTRGLHCLLHGELAKAADYNILLLPALPVLASGFYYKLSGRQPWLWKQCNRPGLLLWIICLFWILRNIPVYPLSWLNAGH